MKDSIIPPHLLLNLCPKRSSGQPMLFLRLSNQTGKRTVASALSQLFSFSKRVVKWVFNSGILIWAVTFLFIILLPVKGWTQSTKTFTVNTLGDASDPNAGEAGDDGMCDTDPNTAGEQCTCRAAIENQNGNRNLGTNEINFAIPNAPGSGSILIMVGSSGLGPLPPVLGSVIINAKNDDGRRIELDGSMAGGSAVGLRLLGGPCQVTSFIINNFSSHGIFISGTPPPGDGAHVIKGNYIGTDATGKISKGNGGSGIFIDNTPNNTIGGTTFDDLNIISGNKGYGIVIHGADPDVDFLPNGARNNMVKGNFIGLDIDGSLVLPNEMGGIFNDNAPNNRIGDSTDAKAGNKIAGVKNGITVMGSLSEGVGIEGNYFQNGSGAKFAAGIFGRGGKGLYITGNLLADIDETAIDLFLDANGSYNIRKNRFEGSIKTGSKFRFGPGRTAEIDYVNNFHIGTGLAIDAEESLNSKIDWLFLGDTMRAGQAGANLVFKAAGKKDFTNNRWEGMAGVGFNYVADIQPGLQATITQTNELFANNGMQGLHGRIQGSGELALAILDSRSTGSGTDGTHLDIFVSAGAKVDITARGNECTVSGRAGLRVVSDGQKLDLLTFIYERNLLDHNDFAGLEIFNSSIFKKSVTNNTITNNGGPGILVGGNSDAHIENNTISGNTTGILVNDASVASIDNNTITANGKGIAFAGTGTGIQLTNNLIFNNTEIGIDLGNDGVTPNDIGDGDTGLQNFPILTSAGSSGGNTIIGGSLNSTPNSPFRIDFFSNVCNASGIGQGQTFLGSRQVTTDGNGNADFNVTLTGVIVPAGLSFTATATDSSNNTSEFGPCFINGNPVSADLELTTQADRTQATIGQAVTFTLTLINKGPDEATGITVTDILPPGISFTQATASTGNYDNNSGIWTVNALSTAAQATLTITGTTTQAGTIINTAEVTAANQPDPDSSPGNGVATEDDQSSISIGVLQSSADLELTKQADRSQATIGQQVTFTLTLINKGPDEVTGITVTDILPAGISFTQATASTGSYDNSSGIWLVNALGSEVQATLTITGTTTQAGTIINTAEVTAANQPDPDSSPGNGVATEDDQSSVSLNVQQVTQADLELTKTASKTSLTAGESVIYTVRLINKGPNPATGIRVTEIASAGISFDQVTPSAGNYDSNTRVWSLDALNSGSDATLTIVATPTQTGNLINTAEVTSSDQPDPDSSPGNGVAGEDDQGTISVQVGSAAGVEAQIAQLINQVNNLVQQGELVVRQARILAGILNASSELYKKGFKASSVFTLRAFIFSVKVLVRFNRLSGEEGQKLIAAAQNIIRLIESEQRAPQNKAGKPVTLKKSKEDNPASAKLFPNYPNPLYTYTVIPFELAKESKTQLTVYNIEGKIITKILEKVMPAGKHTITWQPKNLSPGIYLLRFQAGRYIETERMVLRK